MNIFQKYGSVAQSPRGHLRQLEIRQLMDQLTELGDKLARFRSVRDVAKFKQTVMENKSQ